MAIRDSQSICALAGQWSPSFFRPQTTKRLMWVMATTKDLGHHMNDYYHHHLLEETLGGTQTTTGINFQCLLALCCGGWAGLGMVAEKDMQTWNLANILSGIVWRCGFLSVKGIFCGWVKVVEGRNNTQTCLLRRGTTSDDVTNIRETM